MGAAQRFKVKAVGYEINPLLVIYCRLAALYKRSKNVEFRGSSLWLADLSEFNYVYVYLYPTVMEKLASKLEKELKTGAVIVSKVFEIKSWKKKLVKRTEIGGKNLWIYRI